MRITAKIDTVPHAMKKLVTGMPVDVRIAGGDAVPGHIRLASGNEKSLMVTLDDGGAGIPFALLGDQQALVLSMDDDGRYYTDLISGKKVEVTAR